ncbi:DUF4350 domain-containing protein [Hymenobacter sp. UYCo722]|uniref:DUF4350 domain-containing protein n=1 Tax=Hymenobacter sp. UYCo722 TaxID=3156335 RepID=UPI0033936573
MMRHVTTFRLYMLGLTLLFGVYVVVESHRPKPLDWTPTYINTDKIPYGTYALFDQLPRLLGTDSIEVTRLPAYNQLTGLSLDDSPTGRSRSGRPTVTVRHSRDSAGNVTTTTSEAEAPATDLAALPLREGLRANYLFVNNAFANDALDGRALLALARRGNAVFITAEDLNGAFAGSLGVRVERLTPRIRPTPGHPFGPDSVELRFSNPALAAGHCWLPGNVAEYRFVLRPGAAGHTLATDARGRPVYVELPVGRGHLYLCAVPAAFSNRYFLQPRTRPFAVAALRYLPARRTFWDEYQKQGAAGEQSLLRVLVAHEPLRLAYFITLAGAVLFVLTGARRRQRIIPTINLLPNTTLLFTRTVAGLYRQGRSHGLIAEKKVSLFMDYLRTRFQEPSPDFGDEQFRERLSQKSGVPRPRVDELLRLVNFARTAPQMTDAQLLQLSSAVNDFKREVRR